MRVYKKDEVINLLNLDGIQLAENQYSSIIQVNGQTVVVPNRGLRLFPRRAILRAGMLLRESPIAEQVRTQLLNIEEKVDIQTKTQSIEWTPRDKINKIMRTMAAKVFHGNWGAAYNKLKEELLYKHNICITNRINHYKFKHGKSCKMYDVLDNEEIQMALQSTMALCKLYKLNIDEILCNTNTALV